MPGQFSGKNMKTAFKVMDQGQMSPNILITSVVYRKTYSYCVTLISEQQIFSFCTDRHGQKENNTCFT